MVYICRCYTENDVSGTPVFFDSECKKSFPYTDIPHCFKYQKRSRVGRKKDRKIHTISPNFLVNENLYYTETIPGNI